MGTNLAMVPLSPGVSLYSRCLKLRGVNGLTWWDDPDRGTVMVVLIHAWWTWRGFRDRNRRIARTLVESIYGPLGEKIEVL